MTSQTIADKPYTGERLSLESLDELLTAIDLALPDVVIERRGRLVTFAPGAGVGRLVPPLPPRSSRVEAGA